MQVIAGIVLYFVMGFFYSLPVPTGVKDLYWLPFRPILVGIKVGLIFAVPVLLTGIAFDLKMFTSLQFGYYMLVVQIFCMIAYWAPVAYFVRKFSGDQIRLKWL